MESKKKKTMKMTMVGYKTIYVMGKLSLLENEKVRGVAVVKRQRAFGVVFHLIQKLGEGVRAGINKKKVKNIVQLFEGNNGKFGDEIGLDFMLLFFILA